MSNHEDDERLRNMSEEERLRMENEIEKLKRSAFDNAIFHLDEDLPPDAESEWLEYLAHFEKNWEDIKRISIEEKLGCPQFPPVEELSASEIAENLDKVQRKMADAGIFLTVICEVPKAEIYRFITEELFQYEVEDVDIEGLQTHFIYEEFYPNDKLDIEQALTDFIHEMLDKEFHSFLNTHVAKICRSPNGEALSGEEATEKAIAFTQLYDWFEVKAIEKFHINVNDTETEAKVSFYCRYRAVTNQAEVLFEGEATAKMVVGDLGYWNIAELRMPGFCF